MAANAVGGDSPLKNPVVLSLITAITTVAVAKGATLIADAVMGPPEKSEQDLHEEIHRVIDTKLADYRMDPQWFNPQVSPAPAQQQTVSRKVGTALAKQDAVNHIRQAIDHLNKAKSETNCSYCQKKISGAIDVVTKEVGPVQNALRKQATIASLKARGKLPPGVSWDKMNFEQRKIVNNEIKAMS